MKRSVKLLMPLVCLIIIGVLSVSTITAQDNAEGKAEATLYDRLGGVYSIATVVDELIERLVVNEILNANPAIDKAHKTVPKAGIKFQLTALVCQAAGGPQVYNGLSMKDSHAHLNITNAEWDEMVRVFSQLLNDFNVPENEQKELFALISPTKSDIVTK